MYAGSEGMVCSGTQVSVNTSVPWSSYVGFYWVFVASGLLILLIGILIDLQDGGPYHIPSGKLT